MSERSIFIAGHRGLVGSALMRLYSHRPGWRVITRTRQALDLRAAVAVDQFFNAERPQHVILAAARVGGIRANADHQAEFLLENLQIQNNTISAAFRTGVERFLFLGSSCIYPRHAPQPIREESLLTGPLEPTNEGYALAKIAGLKLCQFINRQHGRRFISAMPTNLYGPNDNFDLASSHVLPALLRRFHEAKASGAPHVTLWGTGTPRREFLHVDDCAEACAVLLDRYDSAEPINVGVGDDVSIRDLATLVAEVVGFQGELRWDTSQPDGTPRKLLDVSRIHALGWRARIGLREGITTTYRWFCENAAVGSGTHRGAA